MLEPLPAWRSTLKQLAEVDNIGWAPKFAGWVSERSTMKLTLQPVIGSVMYNFPQGLFQADLMGFSPLDNYPTACVRLAQAWQNAAMASTIVVMPGSSLMAPSPATTWSAVAAIIDPPSVMLGRMRLQQKLMSSPTVENAFDSGMAEAFRDAFLSLTATVTGINSLPIPSPLVSPMTPSC